MSYTVLSAAPARYAGRFPVLVTDGSGFTTVSVATLADVDAAASKVRRWSDEATARASLRALTSDALTNWKNAQIRAILAAFESGGVDAAVALRGEWSTEERAAIAKLLVKTVDGAEDIAAAIVA